MLKRVCILLFILIFLPLNVFGAEYYISAESYAVIDAKSNTVLFESNANEERSMASTTKIMTCLLACESDKIFDDVEITNEMLDGAIGSLVYLNVGDTISFEDLIKGAMLASGNDAANAIAVIVGGSIDCFVEMMNDKANKIGMKNTCFVTPSGLDKGNHHSTAYDMAILTAEALKNKRFAQICSMRSAEITINGRKQTIYNHNKLLSNKDCVGVKTGYTDKAGRCLVCAFDYFGNTIIVVTFSAPNDWDDHIFLYKKAKKKYKKRNETKSYDISVVGGNVDSVKCTAEYSLYSLNDVELKAYYYPFLYSPTNKGDVVGYVEIYENNMLLKTIEIIVGEDV